MAQYRLYPEAAHARHFTELNAPPCGAPESGRHMEVYKTLLSSKRFRETTIPERELIEETESDRGRVLFSAAFRRLAQKTQVFPLESSSSVRSRLTHSLEVAYLGRLIAQKAWRNLASVPSNKQPDGTAFANLVETACLMHDIGNPPFGHFGEAAIQDWFRKHGEPTCSAALSQTIAPETLASDILPDFEHFEGNAQGLRIATRLQWKSDERGLNLTLSQLATYIKYPRCTTEPAGDRPYHRKTGIFRSELEIANKVWKHFNLDRTRQRFPLTYIVEAADDIAYCLGDIEDGLDKGIISQDQLRTSLIRSWDEEITKGCTSADPAYLPGLLGTEWRARDNSASDAEFFNFKTRLTRDLVNESARLYAYKHDDILAGSAGPLLSSSPTYSVALKALKSFARCHLFRHRDVEDMELAGHRILTGLLDHFKPLLELKREDFEAATRGKREGPSGIRLDSHMRLLGLFPNKHLLVYRFSSDAHKDAAEEWFFRAHLVVDYISGMTDRFALETYQLLSGIRVGK